MEVSQLTSILFFGNG